MKIKTITEIEYPNRTVYSIVYEGCKSSNNGLKHFKRETLTRRELEFIMNTIPERDMTYSGNNRYRYYAE